MERIKIALDYSSINVFVLPRVGERLVNGSAHHWKDRIQLFVETSIVTGLRGVPNIPDNKHNAWIFEG